VTEGEGDGCVTVLYAWTLWLYARRCRGSRSCIST